MRVISESLLKLKSQCDTDSFIMRFSTFTDNLFRAVLNLPAIQTENMLKFKKKKILDAQGGADLRTQLLEIFLTRWHELGTELKRIYVPGLINKVLKVFNVCFAFDVSFYTNYLDYRKHCNHGSS